MGRVGSDHIVSIRRDTARWEQGEEAALEEARSCDLLIKRVIESDGKHAHHVVECKLEGSPLALQQRFFPSGSEDPEGRAAAIRFAMTTDSLPAFRAYLLNNPDLRHRRLPAGISASSSPALGVDSSGVITRANTEACLTIYASVRQNTMFGLCFTAAIFRLQDGSLRSISFRNADRHNGAVTGQVAAFLHSSAFRSWVNRVAMWTLSCTGEAGVCRLDGAPAGNKCKHCGELEHPECHSQTNQQACEDYLCSTCLMVERKEILAIRLDEQSEGAVNLKELWNEARSVYMDNCNMCCVCGCEDNEDLDDLVPCLCESNRAVVHTNCAAACMACAVPKVSDSCTKPLCLICGGGSGVLENGDPIQCRDDGKQAGGIKRSTHSIQAGGVGAKRSRMSSTNGLMQIEHMPDSVPFPEVVKIENNVPAVQMKTKDTDSEKPGAARLGRRFNDAPAVVPIKKRRIQIAEVSRSPSPPPKMLSPKPAPSLPNSPSPKPTSLMLDSPCSKPVPALPNSTSPKPRSSLLDSPSSKPTSSLLSLSSPTQTSPLPSSPSPKPATPLHSLPSPKLTPPLPNLPSPKAASQLVRASSPKSDSLLPMSSSPDPTSPLPRVFSSKPTSPLLKSSSSSLPRSSSAASPSQLPKLPSLKTLEQTPRSSSGPPPQGSRSHLPASYPDISCNVEEAVKDMEKNKVLHLPALPFSFKKNQPDSSQEVEDGELVISSENNMEDVEVAGESPEVSSWEASRNTSQVARSDLGGFQDDRLRWDLNTEMETWDKLTDKVTNIKEGLEIPCRSTSPGFDESMLKVKANEHLKDSVRGSGEEDAELVVHDEYEVSECKGVETNDGIRVGARVSSVVVQSVHSGGGWTDAPGFENPASWRVAREGEECRGKPGYQDDSRERHVAAAKLVGRQASLSRTKGEKWNQLPEEFEAEEHVDYGDSDCRDADDAGLEVDDRTLMLQDEGNWKVDDTTGNPVLWESKTTPHSGEREKKQDDELPEPCVEKCSTSGRTRPTGWDQLPEGFDNAEEALRAAREISSRRGRGGPWVSSSGRGSMASSQGALTGHRFGSGRDASRDGLTNARTDNHFRDRRIDEPVHGREGFSHVRRLDDNVDDYNTGRGRLSARGAAGIHTRGRFSGWVDTQGGSMGQWGPGRHRSTSGFSSQGPTSAAAVSAARVESSGFVVAPDGTITRGGNVGAPGRGGLRSTFGGSRGGRGPLITVGRGPPADMEAGSNFPTRVGVGIDRGMGISSNGGMDLGGRGVGQGARPGLAGSMSDRGVLAGRGPMDRYGGPSFGSRGLELRRSESPRRLHPSDHLNVNSRTLGPRLESRVARSRLSPPSRESFGRSKFLSTSSTQSQRSPPSSSKWSNDRREAESFRERDFKRSLPRSYGPSGRTSPHVVHGSSLMDERDWQVLAGKRSSPGARGGLSSSVYSGKSGGDGSSEVRRSKRAEDGGHTGSHSKDGDHGRISPRDGDKDRDARGSAYRRDKGRDDDRRRDSHRLSSRDSRSTGGHKRASSRDGDDDVAPRRRRPS